MSKFIVSGNVIQRLVERTRTDLDHKFLELLRGHHKFSFGNRITQAQPIDAVRWASEMIPESFESTHIRNTILSALSDSESIQGTSAVVCLAVLLEALKGKNGSPRSVENDLCAVSTLSRRRSSKDLINSISQMNRDMSTFTAFRRTIEKCGANGTIQVVSSKGDSTVTRNFGYKFPVVVPEQFLSASGSSGNKRLLNARVISIDGIVEQMSEIDGIVGESYAKKTPLLIFARGFSVDVQNTLGVNYSHGNLQVIPISVPYDELGAHLITDISTVCVSDIVSSEKGEIVSGRKWSDLNAVSSISVSFNQHTVTIENENSEPSVRTLRNRLRKERIQQETSIVSEIIDRRLTCLMGSGSLVSIGSDCGDLSGIYRDRITSCIRTFKSCAKYGTINLKESAAIVDDPTLRRSLITLSQFFDTIGISSLLTGARSGISCATMIKGIGAIVCSDRK